MREKRESLKQQQEQLSRAIAPDLETSAAKDSSTFASSSVPNQLSQPGKLLTTGEAYPIAVSRGLDKSQVTYRRWLSDSIAVGKLPQQLESLGLVANFEVRSKANPNSNTVRWLRFEK